MAKTATYALIASNTLGSAQSTVSFSSIPGTYTDLIMIMSGTTVANARIDLGFGNGSIDTTSSYSNTELLGNGTSATSLRNTTTTTMQGLFDSLGTGTGQVNFIVNVMDYSNTTIYKTVIGRSNSASNGVTATVGLWRKTNAIDTLIVQPTSNFAAGSTFRLYGIQAGNA